MVRKEPNQTSNMLLPPRGKTKRFETALRSRLRANACVALSALLWSGSLFCLVCCASKASGCCSRDGIVGPVAIDSARPVNEPAYARHGCCKQRREGQNDARNKRSSNSKDKQRCCWHEPQTSSQSPLTQSFDDGGIASTQTSQPAETRSSAQWPEFIWRASVTNRGSTYLRCRVLLI